MTSHLTPIKQFSLGLLNPRRTAPRFLVAGILYLACYYVSVLVRYRLSFPNELVYPFAMTAPCAVFAKCLIVFWLERWRAGRTSWLRQLDAGLAGVSIAAVLLVVVNHTVFTRLDLAMARSVFLIDWCLCAWGICLSRFLWLRESEKLADLPSWPQIVTYCLVLLPLCIAALYYSLGHLPDLNSEWFDGDVLFPVHVVEDVVAQGNSLSGWVFPHAPFVFPDFVLTLASRSVASHPAVVAFLTGALLFLLVCCSAYYGVALATPHRRTAFLLVALAAAGIALIVAWRTIHTDLKFLFFPAFHTGTYGLAIILAAAGIHLVTTEDKRWPLIALLASVGFCAGFSDLLTIAYVATPLTVAMAIGWLLNLVSFRRSAFVSLLIWLPLLFGASCTRAILRMHDLSGAVQLSNATAGQAAERMLLGMFTELQHLKPLFLCAMAWLLGCGIWLSVCVYRLSRNTWDAETLPLPLKRRILLLLTLGLAGLSTISALVLGGNNILLTHDFEKTVHYLHPFIFAPLLFWPLLIPDSALDRLNRAFPKPVLLQIGVVFLLVPVGFIVAVGKGPYRLHRYVPAYVAHLDQIANERGLTQGVSYYWSARDINLYSQNGLRVFTVTSELMYLDWINNRDWVRGPFDHEHGPPRPEFVILSSVESYSRETAVRYLGEPTEEIRLNDPTGAYTVLIYDKTASAKLAAQVGKSVSGL
jgi:hypothetical protein